MASHTIAELEVLLENFKKTAPLKAADPTYMELSGYPHFENVSSNILSFFFDTRQVHGFQELFLQAITDCIADFKNVNESFEVLSVEREFSTDVKKRIDLIIECGTFVITIENKIFHRLVNDLKNYKDTIEKRFRKKQNRYYIVLSPRKEPVDNGFISVTYNQFFDRLKAHLSDYCLETNNAHLIFLNDFIQTIENLTGMDDSTINKQTFDFFFQNNDLIDALFAEKVNMENLLFRKRRQVADNIDTSGLTGFVKQWIWKREVIAFEFIIDAKTIVLDIWIGLNHIEAELFERDGVDYKTIDKLEIVKNQEYKQTSKRGYLIFTEDKRFYEIKTVVFAEKIRKILEKIKISLTD
ncbi:PD-(D/E)XK nuclease family protein [Arachidicoccus terrestris]|uniref:PD-(D/E)XK nuclease family protein n=1 Tax=Arachidicoccus terrestris TaxID=2875539 RepID=UPI001CC7E8BF|nr:PD-(D/E)XK nuclease family protein [Arachidicoccus terrestris]UAY55721.1 PD-(D/E)XK nuclease family protein [Arachidicoccus terrestris]